MNHEDAPRIIPPADRGLHPHPQMQRPQWRSLDGEWEFAYDDDVACSDPRTVRFNRTIVVPYPPESKASGIGDTGFHPALWYRRRFQLTREERAACLLLHFGAVDYEARVWVNSRLVGEHHGGHTPFTCDITDAVRDGERCEICVLAIDDPHDLAKPRGKQDWLRQPHEIWYPRTSGIWQTVWIEPVPKTRIGRVNWRPMLERWEMGLDVTIEGPVTRPLELRVRMQHADELLADDRYQVRGHEVARSVAFSDPGIDDYRNHLLWTPEKPVLIEAEIELWGGGRRLDAVSSYSALRSVGVTDRHFLLNGRPYYLRMVLDQGYWPDTLLAPPSSEALREDVQLARALGYNAIRKHQKVEDPRWLYWCDRLGMLVWTEMPSPYRFTPTAVNRLVEEWIEVVRRDRSHPCVAAWVPLNESWGVPDLPTNAAHRDYVRALYHLTKTLDPSRPVVGNDGWEHVATDLVTIHDYAADPRVLLDRYSTLESVTTLIERQQPGGRRLIVGDLPDGTRPVILSEFGGVTEVTPDEPGWGYSRVPAESSFLATYTALLAAVHRCRGIAGFCYTQLTDTFQERNGLLTMGREPKADLGALSTATRGRRNPSAMDVNPIIE
jgi:beta-galactosidase/beta-glucuronidase